MFRLSDVLGWVTRLGNVRLCLVMLGKVTLGKVWLG